jgi:hypothetical protein
MFVTVSETGTVRGLARFGEVMVTVPLYGVVEAVRDCGCTETERLAGVVDCIGVTVSHVPTPAATLTAALTGMALAELTVKVWAAGACCPAT